MRARRKVKELRASEKICRHSKKEAKMRDILTGLFRNINKMVNESTGESLELTRMVANQMNTPLDQMDDYCRVLYESPFELLKHASDQTLILGVNHARALRFLALACGIVLMLLPPGESRRHS